MPQKKKKRLKIGIVGCGAIGSSLAKAVIKEFFHQAELTALFDINPKESVRLARALGRPRLVVPGLKELINKVDLVIEAACAISAAHIAKKTISSSRDVMIMSVGGIITDYKRLAHLAEIKNARIFIPSGAISGIDGLKAAVCGKVNRVILTTKKHPKAFLGVPYLLKRKIRLDKIKKDKVIFTGNALSAVKAFPQNINVAATLSIAGIGPKKTFIRIVASPNLTRNTHEIVVESKAARIISKTENTLHPDNPKTSYLAVLSAVVTLKQILSALRIGS